MWWRGRDHAAQCRSWIIQLWAFVWKRAITKAMRRFVTTQIWAETVLVTLEYSFVSRQRRWMALLTKGWNYSARSVKQRPAVLDWMDVKSWFESWSQAHFHSRYSLWHQAKLRSNYSASKTGRGIVFSPPPGFYLQVKTGITVEATPQKKMNLLTEEAEKGEGGEGSKPRWNKGERSLDGERSGVVSESVTFTVSRSNLDSYSCCFFFALDSRLESYRKTLSHSCWRERETRVFIWTGSVWKI